jgi:hypothetical protein
VNITDGDGDTPLYTVETVETARFLVQHGAIVERTNNEGISVRFHVAPVRPIADDTKPSEHLSEDFNEVAIYLQSTLATSPSINLSPVQPSPPSQHLQNVASEHLTSELMASVEGIIQRAEAEGRDPEEEIRQVVSRTVLQGVATGFDMSTIDSDRRGPETDSVDGTPAKRPRPDDGSR